jgi:hypothetical protein
MKQPNRIEEQIDKIRIDFYEKTKHMSRKEFLQYFRKIGEEVAQEYGFKIADSLETPGEKKKL